MRDNNTGKRSNKKVTKKSSKSKQKLVLIIAAVALAAVALTYFMIPDKINDIAGIEKEYQTVYLGETFSPEYVVKPGKFKDKTNEITFSMSDSNVASVNNKGEIQAFKLGETVLTMSVMNYVEEVTIQVIPTVTAINDVKNKVTLTEGDTKKLTPSITPAEDRFADEKITYKMENKNVAAVNGKGVITAKAPGTTKLTISAGGFEKVITVVVGEYIPNQIKNDSSSKDYSKPQTTKKDDNKSDKTESKKPIEKNEEPTAHFEDEKDNIIKNDEESKPSENNKPSEENKPSQ